MLVLLIKYLDDLNYTPSRLFMEFKILKKSTKSQARLGLLKTAHGEMETPALVTVATQAVVKTLTAEEVKTVKSQLLICNTYHLHQRPGEKIVRQAGGLHRFMNWPHPLMTDSGGFQVFSLGFGRDLGIGKTMKYFPGPTADQIDRNRQPAGLKILPDGVIFK
ncbi:MAG: tRNA-guanine transglycosylase, partial [Patescibacteria group bacterium]